MKVQDDRTTEQRERLTVLVVGTDSFLSGWGEASNGASFAGWACEPGDAWRVERWVRDRGDMQRVRLVGTDYRPNPAYCAHFHVYPVTTDHPARQ